MRKVRRKLILIAAIGFAALIMLGYAFAPYLDAYRINKELDIDGVRLLMTSSEVEAVLGKGSIIGGFGAEFYEYGNSAVKVAYSWDGLLKGKASWIQISDPKYSICGVRAGDTAYNAYEALKLRGFTQDRTDKSIFKRGSASISVFEGSVRVDIEDWTIRGRVY